MSAVSDFLARDALAAAVVALVMASPAAAAAKAREVAKPPVQRTHVAARPDAAKAVPLAIHVAAARLDDEARLAGVRKAYDGMVATRDQLHEGTRACMKDQRWLLLKVSDSFADDGQPMSESYVEGVRGNLRRALDTRRRELSASRAAAGEPVPVPASAPSREAQRAMPSDLDRLRDSVDRLHRLRTSCLGWAERTVERVSAAVGAPMASGIDRLREARAAAERDYRAMQAITPDSAGDALAAMESGSGATALRIGSL